MRRVALGAAVLSTALLLDAGAAAKGESCDVACDATCGRCCAAWEIVATCGDRVLAIATTHFDARSAQRVADAANADPLSRFECSDGGSAATWQARCAGNELAPRLAAELGAQRRLVEASLGAIEPVRRELATLLTRPDLKPDAARRARRLVDRLANHDRELQAARGRLALASVDDATVRRARDVTTKLSQDLKDAHDLGKDQRAIDPDYEARVRREAERRAKEEKDKEEAARLKEAELLAKKKAAAERALKEVERKERAALAGAQLAKQAEEIRSSARSRLMAASKLADGTLLTAIKFLSQRNLSKTGRSKAEQSRARLEAHKRELEKTFAELRKVSARDPQADKLDAERLARKVAELMRSIERERTKLLGIIGDKGSVVR